MSSTKLNAKHKNCLSRYVKENILKLEKQSLKNRKSAINKFMLFLQANNLDISQADYHHVEIFLEQELENEISPVTLNNYYSYLKGFFKFCRLNNDNNIIDYNKIQFLRVRYSNIEYFNDDNVVELFKLINRNKRIIVKIRDRFLFNILFYTGCTFKELHSLNIYNNSSNYTDDDNYILLDKKTIHFRNPHARKLQLPDFIIEDIKNYFRYYEEKKGLTFPNRTCLFLSVYNQKGKTNYNRIEYNSLMDRITVYKKLSSFKDKKLSIKNIRHTFIKKLIEQKEDIELIRESLDIDISTLKVYYNNSTDLNDEINMLYRERHPFKKILF